MTLFTLMAKVRGTTLINDHPRTALSAPDTMKTTLWLSAPFIRSGGGLAWLWPSPEVTLASTPWRPGPWTGQLCPRLPAWCWGFVIESYGLEHSIFQEYIVWWRMIGVNSLIFNFSWILTIELTFHLTMKEQNSQYPRSRERMIYLEWKSPRSPCWWAIAINRPKQK